jgi:hypothetical protein
MDVQASSDIMIIGGNSHAELVGLIARYAISHVTIKLCFCCSEVQCTIVGRQNMYGKDKTIRDPVVMK